MGVVIRQSFWGTAIAYLGVLIGYFNTLYLRPEFLTLDQIGIFTLVTANAMLISPLCSAGMPGTLIKYFPEIGSQRKLKDQFFTLQFLIVIILNLLIGLVAYLNADWIAGLFREKSSTYVNYLAITGIIIITNSVFELMFAYCRSLLNVIIPSFIRDVALRTGAVILIGGYVLDYWTFHGAVQGLAINYAIALIALFLYLIIKHNLRFTSSFSEIDIEWKKRIFRFGMFLMLMAISFSVMNNVNYLQISTTLGSRANGIFTTCFFIGVIVEMPRRNMLKIVSPLFSKAMQTNDLESVNRMYQKGSITMSVLGLLLCIGILTNIDDLFTFIPQGSAFQEGFWVVVIICATKLMVMLFSFSQEIMVFSKYYKYSLYYQIFSAILLVTLNVILLPIYGLVGAGFSYAIAVFFNTFLRYIFLKKRMHVDPFVKAHVPLLVISAFTLLVFIYLPFPFNPFVNIVVRSLLTTLVFVTAIFKTNISEDINQLIRLGFEKVLKIKI
ncbi:MAG: oligosaccharide flippase family protein [Cytophagales bacterium]|nr:oligosaccharide flippase family protein [Cytophagales bacterium]